MKERFDTQTILDTLFGKFITDCPDDELKLLQILVDSVGYKELRIRESLASTIWTVVML